jgi:hypothetical protein
MPTVFDQIQACDGRDLIQKLTYYVITELGEKKVIVCNGLTGVFEGFGLEGFSPCESINDQFVERLLQGDTRIVFNPILATLNLPPYTLQILTDGYDSLTAAEKAEVEDYIRLRGLTFIQNEIQSTVILEVKERIKCPSQERLVPLLNTLQNITNTLTRLQSIFNRLDRVIVVSSATVSALNALIQSSQAAIVVADTTLPIQAATPTGAAGLTARIASRLETIVGRYTDQVAALDEKLCNASQTMRFVNTQLIILQSFLQVADALLRGCLIETPSFSSQITPRSSTPTLDNLQYRGYTIEIRTVPGNTVAPQRFAVALDPIGVVVLEGSRSYSSSTQILVEELKFRIDNLLG